MRERADAVLEELGDLSEFDVRKLGLEAIRKCVPNDLDRQTPFQVDYQRWLENLLELVLSKKSNKGAVSILLKREELSIAVAKYHIRVWRFWQWMEHAGYALYTNQYIYDSSNRNTWAITELGIRRLKSEPPYQPDIIKRLRDKFGSDHADSLARLEDAIRCLDYGLNRPAVVLLGVAFEGLMTRLLERIDPDATANSASQRQDIVRERIEREDRKAYKEARRKALCALNVADSIRTARNEAVHEPIDGFDAPDVHELIADGLRAYPKLAGYKAP